jgi:hypothetical protein
MSRIVISYRRQDAAGYAGRLYDRLVADLGDGAVFMDIDAIDLGEDFVAAIEACLERAAVLLAVIGRHWLDTTDERGDRRLDAAGDFVRVEISTALQRGVRVIPVLVDGALMPKESELPEDLRPLLRRQALTLDHETFNAGVNRLLRALRRPASQGQAPGSPAKPRDERAEEPHEGKAPKERTPKGKESALQSAQEPAGKEAPTLKTTSPPRRGTSPTPSRPHHGDPERTLPAPSRRSPEVWLALAAIAALAIFLLVRFAQAPDKAGGISPVNTDTNGGVEDTDWTWLEDTHDALARNRQRLATNVPPLDAAARAKLEEDVLQAEEQFSERLVEYLNAAGMVEGAPKTRQQEIALRWKADEDILIAQLYLQKGGDYARAIQIYESALEVNPNSSELKAALAWAREHRYMNRERFSRAKKGMTEVEVREVLGPVSPRMIKVFETHQVTAWYYPKGADQGAAGVYFQKGKAYNLNFDAVKPAAQ